MKEPIFYKHEDDSETFIFRKVRFAEGYIEPIAIKLGGGVFYDSEGKILKAKVVEDERGIENTVISDDGKELYRASELKGHLVHYLTIVHHSRPDIIEHARPELEKMKLAEIVKESLKLKTEW